MWEGFLSAPQGVVQNLKPYDEVQLLEPVALDENGEIIDGAIVNKETGEVTVDGAPVQAADIVTEQVVPSRTGGEPDFH